MTDWQAVLQDVQAAVQPALGQGQVADYIPALARADARDFGMSVALNDGRSFEVGKSGQRFSIQSISKVFSLTLALRYAGDRLWERVGREPSGTAFNSIVQLERERGVPRNPFINAGAMVVTDTIVSQGGPESALDQVLALVRRGSGAADIASSSAIAESERDWGDRNRSLAYFMKSFGILQNDPETVLSAYFGQCAIEMTTTELARAGRFLANEGIDPVSGARVAPHDHVNRIGALMLTCGHYDMSGDFAFRVGLPGKSGVGGGILAIAPGLGAIAVWSPGLNEAGNSLAGTLALEHLSHVAGLNLF